MNIFRKYIKDLEDSVNREQRAFISRSNHDLSVRIGSEWINHSMWDQNNPYKSTQDQDGER